MFTERRAIEEQLENLQRDKKEHRQALMDIRNDEKALLQRLREIDERDMKSNSIDVMENLSSKLTDVVGSLANIIPDIPASTMIEHLQKQGTIKAEQVVPLEEKVEAPTKVEEAAQEQLLHMKPKRLSIEEASAIIKKIIEDKGEGAIVSLPIIEHEFHERTGLKYVAFSQKMTDAMEIFPSIQRASRGKFKIEPKPKKETKTIMGYVKKLEEEKQQKQLLEA